MNFRVKILYPIIKWKIVGLHRLNIKLYKIKLFKKGICTNLVKISLQLLQKLEKEVATNMIHRANN